MTRKNVLFRLCSLAIVTSMIMPMGVQAIDRLDKSTIDMTIAERERFLDVVSAETETVATAFDADISADTIKALLDFAGNSYTLIECEPSGYMIYHNASGQFVETSATSPSPYAGFDKNLYYAGPTQYYVLENGIYKHTVIDESHTQDEVDAYSAVCEQANENYIESANVDIIDYIESGEQQQVSSIAEALSANESAPTYITNAYCLSNCETASEMSYFGKNACGYIAAALLMLWYRETINSTYLSTNNSTGQSYLKLKNGVHVFNGDPNNYANGKTFSYNLWRWHSGLGQSDYENGYYGTGAGEIATTLESYVKGKGLPYTYDTDVLPLTSSIISKIDSRDRPYLLWGTGVQPVDESQKKCDHAVIVYGHWNGYLLCNFGWPGYSCSSVKGFWGSGLMLRQ